MHSQGQETQELGGRSWLFPRDTCRQATQAARSQERATQGVGLEAGTSCHHRSHALTRFIKMNTCH